MGNRTARALRGFAIMDPRCVLANLAANDGSANGSDYEQAGSRPGSPVPSDARSFFLPHAHNGQDADLDVQVLRQGEPGIDDLSVVYREDGEADTSFRGWNEPNLVTGYSPIAWTTTEDWSQIDAVTIPSTQQVVVVAADQDATARLPVSSWTWSPQTRTWGARVALDSGNAGVRAAVAIFPDTERVVAWCTSGAVTSDVDAYFMDPGDTTWTQYGADCLRDEAFDAAVDQIRTAVDRHGNVLLLAVDNATGDRWVYRSTDRGLTFTFVETTAAWGMSPQLVTLATGDILVTYLDAATDRPSSLVLEDAFDSIGSGTEIVAIAAALQTTWVDADGIVYCAWQPNATPERVRLHRTIDDSATWDAYDFGLVERTAGSTWEPRAAASSGGDALLFMTTTEAVATGTEGSLIGLRLGGWATVEAGLDNVSVGTRTARASGGFNAGTGWGRVFLPSNILDNDGWASAGTAETLLDGYHRFNPAAATSSASVGFAHQDGRATYVGEFQVVSGGSLTTNACAFSIRRGDASFDYRMTLRFATTGFRVRDDWASGGAGLTLGEVVIDMTSVLQVMVALTNHGASTQVTVLYKRPASSIWLLGPQATLTTPGPSVATDLVNLGCLVATTSDFRVGALTWYSVALRATENDASGYFNRMRWGKPLSNRPYPVRDQGPATNVLHVSGDGGAGRYRESFELPTLYDHGIDRLFPTVAPSRSQYWQANSTDEQIIAFDFGGLPTQLDGSFTWAFALLDTNLRTAVIETRTDPGAWTTLATWNASTGFESLTFDRSGDTIRVAAGTAAGGRYIQAGELVGGFVILDPAGTPVCRRIVWNSGGVWRDATTKRPVLRLEGMDDTEPASGTLHIVWPSAVLVVPQAGTATTERIRLRIPVQDTVDDEPARVGAFFMGAVQIAGRQWSRGWSVRYLQNLATEEDEDGTLYVDDRGPLFRELTVAWQDGYDLTAIRNGGDLDYLAPSVAAAALSADQDVWFNVVAMMQLGRGGAVPSIALMSIPSTATTITDATQWMFGPLMGTPQVNHVQGNEGASEVHRMESLTLREQPRRRAS